MQLKVCPNQEAPQGVRAPMTEFMHCDARGLLRAISTFAPLVLLTAFACGRGQPGAAGNKSTGGGDGAQAPLVEALAARRGTLPVEVRVSGVVRARNQVEIRPELAAVVAEVLVRSGDAVEKGQPLVRLEPAPQQQELRHGQASVELAEAAATAAQARLTELEAQASRTRKLAEKAMVSELERETHEAQAAAARASLGQAQARVAEARATVGLRRSSLGKTVIRAPITGRVGQRGAEVGMLVTPATMLFVLGDLSCVIVDVPLTEKMLARVRVGQRAVLRGPALGATEIDAKLSRISPFLAAGSFSTTGEIDVANADARLLPGMFLTADIAVGESESATLVPVSALYEDPRTGLVGVYVVDRPTGAKPGADAASGPHPVKLRPVELRAEGRASVGVGGLEPGTWVVTLGQHLLATQSAKSARVREVAWERVLDLQARQQEDLLAKFLEKQQRLARTRGATPPRTCEVAGAALNERGSTAIP
jgi:HlyD family secretion protein